MAKRSPLNFLVVLVVLLVAGGGYFYWKQAPLGE